MHSTSHTEPPAPPKPHCRPLLFDQEADLSLISDQQSHPDALRADQECHRAHDTYSVVLTITTTSKNKSMSIAHTWQLIGVSLWQSARLPTTASWLGRERVCPPRAGQLPPLSHQHMAAARAQLHVVLENTSLHNNTMLPRASPERPTVGPLQGPRLCA